MEAPAFWRSFVSARHLLACLTALAATPALAQLQFFGPNATLDAPAPNFGGSIAQDGRTAFIGNFSGPTYVYTRRGPLRWDLEATLLPPLGFAGSVAVDGDLAVITGLTDGGPNLPAVVAFVYQRINGTWQLTQTLSAPEEHGPGFGSTVDIEGDIIAIASYSGGGAVFIYRRTASGEVVLQEEIDTEADEQRAALDGDTLLVSVVDLQFPGSPYGVVVYQLTDQDAVAVQTLLPSDPIRGETFGASLSISGNVAVIGAPFAEISDRCGPGSDRFGLGNAFVFERDHGVWHQVALLSNPDCGWFFGGSTATDGKRILSSALYIGDPSGLNADSRSYLYEPRQGTWSLQGALQGPTCSNAFGLDLALVKGTLLTNGAAADSTSGEVGEVYVFRTNHLIEVQPRTCNPPPSP